jgi:hypothetical protein
VVGGERFLESVFFDFVLDGFSGERGRMVVGEWLIARCVRAAAMGAAIAASTTKSRSASLFVAQ